LLKVFVVIHFMQNFSEIKEFAAEFRLKDFPQPIAESVYTIEI